MPTAIFASGAGTNLQAVAEAARAGVLPLDIRLVVSDNSEAFALERARRFGIPTAVIAWERSRETRERYGLRLAQSVKTTGAQLVLLLGWMHVLAPEFLSAGFDGILNLHPSYLPDDPAANQVQLPDGSLSPVFRGAHALCDALAAKVPITGATLIEITASVDRGPVLARKTLALRPEDNEASALERLHEVEQDVVRDGVLRWVERHRSGQARPLH